MRLKIPWAKPSFSAEDKKHLLRALESTWISGGPYVRELEERFCAWHGVSHGLAVSNGTTALQLALLALDIGPGDEVIVPGFTFVAPVNMVIAQGATPVYVDIDPETWCIDPASIERKITRKTKAIIAVHLYGNVCDMDAIGKLARRKGLRLIEDAAESAFSKYKGRPAGTFGDLGCFSFQATKTITTGEGGFVLTSDSKLAERMRVVRDHGMRAGKRYWHDVVGFNFRMTNLQAAIGCAQLKRLGRIISERRRLYRLYRERLRRIPAVAMQRFAPEVEPVVWAITVKLDPDRFRGKRDAIMARLSDAGIETRPGFYPFSVMPLYRAPKLPVSMSVGLNAISLPSFPALEERQIDFICDRLETALARA